MGISGGAVEWGGSEERGEREYGSHERPSRAGQNMGLCCFCPRCLQGVVVCDDRVCIGALGVPLGGIGGDQCRSYFSDLCGHRA